MRFKWLDELKVDDKRTHIITHFADKLDKYEEHQRVMISLTLLCAVMLFIILFKIM